jgi:acyl-CoA synthetase (NDP forming)
MTGDDSARGRVSLSPASVAIVGASDTARSPGRQAVENLMLGGYRGAIWPVNPRYQDIAGLPCFPSLDQTPGCPEAVFVLVSAAQVPGVLSDAAGRGVRLAVVASSGLGEGTPPVGADLAERVRHVVAGSSLRVLGPNTEGFWNIRDRCFVTFGSALRLMPALRTGQVAVVSQSGSIGAALGWRLSAAGVGLSHVVMTGNELDVDALDISALLLDDEHTGTLALFLEGLRDAQRLIGLGKKAAAAGKHVIVLKSGNSGAAKLATLSHTGKFASDAAIYQAAFRQAGIVQVDRVAELLRAAELISRWASTGPARAGSPVPAGSPAPARTGSPARLGLAVIAVSGGSRSLVADAAAEFGCSIPDFAAATEAALQAVTHDYSSVRNPCDIGGWAFSSAANAQALLRPVLGDPCTDSVLIQFASRGREESLTALRAIQQISGGRPAKPVVLSLLTDGPSEECADLAAELGVSIATDPTEAVQALSWLYRAGGRGPDGVGRAGQVGRAGHGGRAGHVGQAGHAGWATERPASPAQGQILDWDASTSLLRSAGISVAGSMVVRGADDVEQGMAALGGTSYVLKLHPDDAAHKTELGGVHVGLRSAAEVLHAYQQLAGIPGSARRALLQPQVSARAEVLVSVFRDPDFGPVACVGAGGVDVESTGAKAYGVLPLTPADIEQVIRDGGALAAGDRPGRENDGDALARLVLAVCGLFGTRPWLRSVELNPVLVGAPGGGAVVVDALIESSTARPADVVGRRQERTRT